jgi:hypothetical protein
MVEKVDVPPGSLASRVPFEDYSDAYRIAVDPAAIPDVDAFARAFGGSPPGWVRMLMSVRDAVVGMFGLERAKDAPVSPDFIGFFRILERNDHEILMGEDDRHLDFRVSILHDGTGVIVSTLVRFHNAFGRAYFVPVAPVHRVIVPAMLRRAVRA